MIGRAIPWGIKLTRTELDLAEPARIPTTLDGLDLSAIINLAAIDLRTCEKNPFGAYRINVFGNQALFDYSRRRNLPYVFISTASVFNGPQGSLFFEDSIPDPLHIYGQTKWLAEQWMDLAGVERPQPHLILRTGWLFGGHGSHHRKFVDIAIDNAKQNLPITASPDQQGSPTSLKDFVETLGELLAKKITGIYHLVNSGAATAAEMAQVIIETLGSQAPLEIKSAAGILQANSGGTTIRRSPCEVLGSRKLQSRPWQDALREYVLEHR